MSPERANRVADFIREELADIVIFNWCEVGRAP